jgi:hypothetical protein
LHRSISDIDRFVTGPSPTSYKYTAATASRTGSSGDYLRVNLVAGSA